LLHLPADTPYGNYTNKFAKLRARVDEANRRLIDSFLWWHATRTGQVPDRLAGDARLLPGEIPPGAYERHVYAYEEAVYHMRRAADELIAMIWSLDEWRSRGVWPSSIAVDCIGAALAPGCVRRIEVCANHAAVLRDLNEIANAFKHSFIHTDLSMFGRDEPCVHALGLEHNKLESDVKFHNVRLAELVGKFSAFYNEGIKWLSDFAERTPSTPPPESAPPP
jgi:hypothetical protein